MLKKIIMLGLLLPVFACTDSANESDSAPAASTGNQVATEVEQTSLQQDLAKSYELLAKFEDEPARELIDKAIRAYQDMGDTEGLATAYTVSTDYYRFVNGDFFKEKQAAMQADASTVEPIPLYMVSSGPVCDRSEQESKLAVDAYTTVIRSAESEKDYLTATNNYYRLAAHYMRNGNRQDACVALDGALAGFVHGKQADESFHIPFNMNQYTSFPEQIEQTKQTIPCEVSVSEP